MMMHNIPMSTVSDLIDIGFSEYEAKVYIALLSRYPETGYQIGKAAGVPRSMVYEALGRLEHRGAVLSTKEEKATFYRPVAPDQFLERKRDETERALKKVGGELNALYMQAADERLWTFTGRKEAEAHAKNLIRNAEREIMAILGDPDVTVLEPYLAEAHQRGVQLGIVLTGTAPFDMGTVIRHPRRETELHHFQETILIVRDEAELLMANGFEKCTATITNNRQMVSLAHQFVWMELFAQRIFRQMGPDLVQRLSPEDQAILQERM
jgi:Cd2+/Zn2+-exporting ATPase